VLGVLTFASLLLWAPAALNAQDRGAAALETPGTVDRDSPRDSDRASISTSRSDVAPSRSDVEGRGDMQGASRQEMTGSTRASIPEAASPALGTPVETRADTRALESGTIEKVPRDLPATPRALSAQQKKNVRQLRADLQSLKSGSEVTAEQRKALATSLANLAEGATKPSRTSVGALSADLASAMKDGQISTRETARLAQDLTTALNSANMPRREIEAVIADVQTILTAGGVTEDSAAKIAADLRAISAEVRKDSAAATKARIQATPASPSLLPPRGQMRRGR
jgi:hypothetical protein